MCRELHKRAKHPQVWPRALQGIKKKAKVGNGSFWPSRPEVTASVPKKFGGWA